MRNALVSVAIGREHASAPVEARAKADFLVHLIATAEQLPQTRARRRVEPVDAHTAYRAVGQWPTALGLILSRSL